MVEAIQWILNSFVLFFELLNRISFTYKGFTIYYGWLLFAMTIFAFFISFFWKGARE